MDSIKITNMVPFVINSNICTSPEDIKSFDTFMDSVAGNTGNSYITYSLLKELGVSLYSLGYRHIKNIYSYDFSNEQKDLSIIENECTHVILVLQDQIRIHESYGYRLPFKQMESFLSKVKKPILVAGLGANSLDGYIPDFHKKIDLELINFLRFLSSICVEIGIRGLYTEEVLHKLGITNVRVIGCPSYYETGKDRIITKKGEMSNYISAPVLNKIDDNSSMLIMQDKQPHEERIIKSICFGQKNLFLKKEFDKIKNNQYRIFSSINSWKETIKGYDFFIGKRVHGSMVALNSGVPSIVLNKDSRAREMCEYMNIPYFPDMSDCTDVDLLFSLCDYTKMNNEYNDKLEIFKTFLQKNGFIYNPIIQEETPSFELNFNESSKATKVGIVNIPYLIFQYFISTDSEIKYRCKSLCYDVIKQIIVKNQNY